MEHIHRSFWVHFFTMGIDFLIADTYHRKSNVCCGKLCSHRSETQLLHTTRSYLNWNVHVRMYDYHSECKCSGCDKHYFNSYSASHDNWCTATLWNKIITAQCEGMGEVGSARYEPALLPPCPSIRVLSYSNCQEIHSRQQTGLAV